MRASVCTDGGPDSAAVRGQGGGYCDPYELIRIKFESLAMRLGDLRTSTVASCAIRSYSLRHLTPRDSPFPFLPPSSHPSALSAIVPFVARRPLNSPPFSAVRAPPRTEMKRFPLRARAKVLILIIPKIATRRARGQQARIYDTKRVEAELTTSSAFAINTERIALFAIDVIQALSRCGTIK